MADLNFNQIKKEILLRSSKTKLKKNVVSLFEMPYKITPYCPVRGSFDPFSDKTTLDFLERELKQALAMEKVFALDLYQFKREERGSSLSVMWAYALKNRDDESQIIF